MKNKKLLKALAALTLSVAAAGCVSLFGCGHSHKYSDEYKWDETGHWHECTKDDGAKTEVKPHEYTDENDTDCNVEGCGYVRVVSGGEEDEYWTVTVDLDNGSTPTEKQVVKGGKLTGVSEPTTADKPGYTFNGWKVNGEAWTMDTAVTANITIVAQWSPVSVDNGYTATLKYDNGSADGSITTTKTDESWYFAKPQTPSKTDYTFAEWYTEAGELFDFTKPVTANVVLVAHWTYNGYTATLVYNNGADNGSLLSTKSGNDWVFAEPTKPEKLYHIFGGWYTDEDLTEDYDFTTVAEKNITLYAKWDQAYDTVTTEWDFLAGAKTINANPSGNVSLTSDTLFQGKFLLGSGARFEIDANDSSKNCFNTQNKTLEFTLSGEDGATNSVAFNAKWGSSSAGSFKIINKKTEETVYESAALTNGSAAFDASVENLPAGTYAVTATGSVRFYSFKVTEKLPQGPIMGIELDTSSVEGNVLLGRAFGTNGLSVVLAYQNGRKDRIELTDTKLSVTAPEDFTTAKGVKTITVKYQLDSETTYTKTYTVNVCEVSELVCYDYVLDSKRVTNNLQVLFGLNGTFNSNNFVVKAKCLVPETTDKYIEFKLNSDEFTVKKPDLTTAGAKDVTISYVRDTEITTKYAVEVAAIPDLSAVTSITITVDPAAEEISTSGTYTVNTINQALQFLKLAKVSEDAVKTISLKKNTVYREKVEIDMKNVVLTTEGVTDEEFAELSSFDYDSAKDLYNSFAVIEYDALNGKLDPSETIVHSTDGSATVSIRAEAENFKAQFVTFKNYYNTNALYNESLKITKDSQAVAALVQADKSSFINCKFTSYHDTLYAQLGRQYYKGCLIEGHTDYIFGYNATAYFDACLIHSIGAGVDKDKNSPTYNGNYNNGGYVVATKGFNKGNDTDAVTYGYIFDGCDFSGDENTVDGSVSIARGWDKNMRIMVMNSTISAKFSKEAYGEKTANEPNNKDMNDRYGKMSADPNADYLLEFNNSGAGAINSDLTNTCKVVGAAVAAKYADLNVVFGTVNGKMTYADAWNPVATKNATIVLKTADDVVVQTMTNISWAGSVVTSSMIQAALDLDAIKTALDIEGAVSVTGYYSDKACTKAYDYTTVLDEGENVIYVKTQAGIVKQTETFDATNANYATGTSLRDKAYTGTSFSIVAGGDGDTKSSAVGMTATADDESGLKFDKAFVPGGKGRTFTVTATKDISITVYFTVTNADITTATTAFTKSGELTVDGKAVTSSGAKSNNVAYAYTLELKAGATAVIGTDSTSNRIVLFGIVAEY